MASLKIDHTVAHEKLEKCLAEASKGKRKLGTRNSKIVASIVGGDHKTYKYILVTALLAKSVDPLANPLSLQAGASIKGAYDARSLCHKVLVPFERSKLADALGGSNEPFVNKPARFQQISRENAVRGGKDTKALDLLCEVLEDISDSKEASSLLTDALYVLLKNSSPATSRTPHVNSKEVSLDKIADKLLEESNEGESVAFLSAVLLDIYFEKYEKADVRSHPTNQPGSSSREISDIDIFLSGGIHLCCEIKDKRYTKEDVRHAMKKCCEGKCKKLVFVEGPRARLTNSTMEEEVKYSQEEGIALAFMKVEDIVSVVHGLAVDLTREEFLRLVEIHLKSMNPKPAFRKRLERILS